MRNLCDKKYHIAVEKWFTQKPNKEHLKQLKHLFYLFVGFTAYLVKYQQPLTASNLTSAIFVKPYERSLRSVEKGQMKFSLFTYVSFSLFL